MSRASHSRACAAAGSGTIQLHVIQLEKCFVAVTEMSTAAADAAPSISSLKSPLAASESPRAVLDRRDSSSTSTSTSAAAAAASSAAASPLSVAASSTSSPLSSPSPSHIAGHIMVMLASSLPATENARRRELFDKALGNVTCHTSHVTHHTSHVTRHTSHVTRHTLPPPLSRHPAATFESTFPSAHPDVAATIVLCAAAAADMGDVTRKRDLCLRALAIYEGKRSMSLL